MPRFKLTQTLEFVLEAKTIEDARGLYNELGPETSLPHDVVSSHYVPLDDPNIVEFEINREIVFASSHVPLDEWNWLYETSQKRGFIDVIEYGAYRIWADVDDGEIAMATPQTYELIKRARMLDCKWLILDHDGPLYPQLKCYK
jgi:hypothetical protein